MTTGLDPRSRAVVAWLREDQHENAERVLLAALDEIDHTKQRGSWWPARRFAQMNTYAKVLVAAAAVIAIFVVGVNMVPRDAGIGGQPAPTPTPSASATAGPSATPPPLPASGQINAGTYAMTDGTSTFNVTVPPGWDADGTDLRKHRDQPGEVTFLLYPPGIKVYPDACVTDAEPPLTGPTTNDLVTALQAQEHSDVSEPTPITIGGRPALRLEVSVPNGFNATGCTIGALRVWRSVQSGMYLAGLGPEGRTPVYIVDGPSGRVVFTIESQAGATTADQAELQGIVDSIQFGAAP